MRKTIFITILIIACFALFSSISPASQATARQVGNDIATTAEDMGDGMRQMGNGIVNGVQNGAGMVRDGGNHIVNGVDTAIDRTENGVRTAGEDAKNQTQTMTNGNTLSNNNWQSATFLGISFSIWMWIILIIVIIIIIVLICKYMKEHDDNRNDRDDD